MKLKTTIRESIVALLALVLIVGVAYAGSLTPPAGTVSPQSYTLGDIYNKISNISYSPSAHTISTTTSPTPSFRTLTEIYNKLATEGSTVIPGNIRSGVTMFGVTGSYTGSGGGGGGTLTWTETIPSMHIVNGTRVYQSGFEPQHGLCWSNGDVETVYSNFCQTRQAPRFNGDRAGGLYEANPNVGPNGEGSIPLGATEYCDYLNQDGITVATAPQHYWRLPTLEELYLKTSLAMINSTYDPTTESQGGFRSVNYVTSEFADTNYYSYVPLNIHDSIKSVNITISRLTTSVNQEIRDQHRAFRCVH